MKKTFCELLFLGLGVVAFRKSGRRLFRETHSQSLDPQELTTALATRRYMMYVLLPVWFVPGVLDWIWHRQTKIETTSGVKESLIHSLMMTEVGLPILMGLFLEINAGVFAAMLGAAALHEATAFWDVGFAVSRRKILPREQHTHSLLEVLPLAAVSFAACLHPEQFLSLFGAGLGAPPDGNPPEAARAAQALYRRNPWRDRVVHRGAIRGGEHPLLEGEPERAGWQGHAEVRSNTIWQREIASLL